MRIGTPVIVCLLTLGVSSGSARAQSLEPLPIVLPKPLFEGTPVKVKVPNLEPPRRGPRAPFLAPAGTRNAALNKLVDSSDPDPRIGYLDQITDGVKEGTDGNWVELRPGLQQITIDLEQAHVIYAVLLWHYHKEPRVYFDDPDFLTGVTAIFNNDHDNSGGFGIGQDMHYIETAEGKLVNARATRGRYVRLYSNGSTASLANHYIEVEVYGKPVE